MTGTVVLILRILLMACLYGFLAWALYLLWNDLRVHAGLISSPRIPPLVLTPFNDDNLAAVTFQDREAVIGRGAKCEYTINDDTISGRHARFSYHHNQWWLEDLNSTNGTFLNDERVSLATVIVSGDELRVGQVRFLIVIQDKNN